MEELERLCIGLYQITDNCINDGEHRLFLLHVHFSLLPNLSSFVRPSALDWLDLPPTDRNHKFVAPQRGLAKDQRLEQQSALTTKVLRLCRGKLGEPDHVTS